MSFNKCSNQENTQNTTKAAKLTEIENFYCEKVIDKRRNKRNLGYVPKGVPLRRVPAIFEGEFEVIMIDALEVMLPATQEKEPLIFIFHKLELSEQTSTYVGQCVVEIEIAKEVNGKLYSLGIFSSKVFNIVKTHQQKIIEELGKCIIDFNNTYWPKEEEEIIKKEAPNYVVGSAPTEGLYHSFRAMCENETFKEDGYELLEEQEDGYIKYQLKTDDTEKTTNSINFISDGESIYIHASHYSYDEHYIKAKHNGRYIYFEDSFSDPNAITGFGGKQLNALVLDTNTGLIYPLSKKNMAELLKNYSEIRKTYDASKKDLAAKEKAILEINELD